MSGRNDLNLSDRPPTIRVTHGYPTMSSKLPSIESDSTATPQFPEKSPAKFLIQVFLLTLLASIPTLAEWTDVRLAIVVMVWAAGFGGHRSLAVSLGGLGLGHLVLAPILMNNDSSVLTLGIQAVVTGAAGLLLLAIMQRSFNESVLRRPAQRLMMFLAGGFLVAIVGGYTEHYAIRFLTEDVSVSGATTAIGIGIAASIAGLFAVRKSSPTSMVERFGAGELLAPLLVVIMTLAAIQITRQIGEQRDQDRLDRVVEVARNAFVDEVEVELTLASVKMGAAGDAVSADPVLFSEEFSGFLATRSSLATISLYAPGTSGFDRLNSLVNSDVGVSANAVSTALDSTDISDPTSFGDSASEQLVALAPVVVRDEPEGELTLLLFRSPVTDSELGAEPFVLFGYSVPALLESGLARSLEDIKDIDFSLARVVDGREVGVLETNGSSDKPQSVSDFSIGTEDYRFIARPVSTFGTDPAVMALILALEAFFGLAILAVLLRGANSQYTMSLERRRRESLLEAALDATPGISVVFDANLNVLTANKSIRDQYAGKIPGLAVTTLFGLQVDSGRERLIHEAMQSALEGSAGHAELAEDGPDSGMKIMEIETYPVKGDGDTPVGFLHAVDTTERRSLAMRSAQSERMESLGSLAGGLAHDFNNLLFVTLGNLQLMAMNDVIAQDEKLSKFVSRSMTAVERGAEITKSLLAVARSQPLEESAVSLADLVKGILPLLRQALGAGRRVEVEIDDPSLQLMVDAGRLSSCILNLAFNSRDAMGPTGTLRIVGRLVAESGMIELSVTDDGKGMPAEIVARAFEPFFTTKSPGSGTGLGLATVYAFAKQSGGTAYLESRPGLGTTVTLVLPRYNGKVETDQAVTQRRAGRRVVVADDEQALAEMVASWLIDMGIDARFATSPKSALELIEEFEPDVLVSDANFGEELDGIELARLGTAIVPEMAVVFMTGFSNSMRELQELGERTLAKPFSREDLYAALSPLIAEEAPSQSGVKSSEPPKEST
ncbi:MAG: hypothetical protein RL119_96 [Actinomycetota bacterium]